MCRYYYDLLDRNVLFINLKIKICIMCILLVGVLFELDEYEIIRIFIIRRVKILFLIDWLIVNWLLNVLVNFFIKIILDVGEGILKVIFIMVVIIVILEIFFFLKLL